MTIPTGSREKAPPRACDRLRCDRRDPVHAKLGYSRRQSWVQFPSGLSAFEHDPRELSPPMQDTKHSRCIPGASIDHEIRPHDNNTDVPAKCRPWCPYLRVIAQEPVERPDLLAIVAGNPDSGFPGEIFKNAGKIGLSAWRDIESAHFPSSFDISVSIRVSWSSSVKTSPSSTSAIASST